MRVAFMDSLSVDENDVNQLKMNIRIDKCSKYAVN